MTHASGRTLLLTPRQAALVAAFAAMGVVGGAFLLQYGFGILPCELCYWQRIPYYVAIPGALLVACLPNASMTVRIGLAMLALIFLCNAGLGAYHSGVEWKLWAGPAGCSGAPMETLGLAADLLSQMQKTAVVSCSEASWRFLGLSLAGWNVLISLALAVVVCLPLRKR